VAEALLLKAGAQSVTCVALGKFGGLLRDYKIEIKSDPFKPLSFAKDAILHEKPFLVGQENDSAQKSLKGLLG